VGVRYPPRRRDAERGQYGSGIANVSCTGVECFDRSRSIQRQPPGWTSPVNRWIDDSLPRSDAMHQ